MKTTLVRLAGVGQVLVGIVMFVLAILAADLLPRWIIRLVVEAVGWLLAGPMLLVGLLEVPFWLVGAIFFGSAAGYEWMGRDRALQGIGIVRWSAALSVAGGGAMILGAGIGFLACLSEAATPWCVMVGYVLAPVSWLFWTGGLLTQVIAILRRLAPR